MNTKITTNRQTREYKHGTYTIQQYPFGWYMGGAALCSDGKVRKIKRISQTADTWFSVPASITVKGKTVAGYISIDDNVVKFRQYLYRKNADLLPPWSKDADQDS